MGVCPPRPTRPALLTGLGIELTGLGIEDESSTMTENTLTSTHTETGQRRFTESANPLARQVHTAAGLLEADQEIPALPPWTAADYISSITGSGAEKLADSGVAPLVAAARGYMRLDESNLLPQLKMMEIRLTSSQGRRLKSSINGTTRDGMQMPWFSAADIQIAARNDWKGKCVSLIKCGEFRW